MEAQENPKHAYLRHVHACPEYAHTSRVPKNIQGKVFDINSCRVNPTSFGSRPTPIYDHYKSLKRHFYNGEDEDIQDSLKNSESKMEFSTLKHLQVKFYLVGNYFGLDL